MCITTIMITYVCSGLFRTIPNVNINFFFCLNQYSTSKSNIKNIEKHEIFFEVLQFHYNYLLKRSNVTSGNISINISN